MLGHYEIDFMSPCADKSADAIVKYYWHNGDFVLHVTDAGFRSTAENLLEHINYHYAAHGRIDHLVITHDDQDHASGARVILENFRVDNLWINRPWWFARELLPRFDNCRSDVHLVGNLRSAYSDLAEAEDAALRQGTDIHLAFAGTQIGAFTVLSPTREFFLQMVLESKKTPKSTLVRPARSQAISLAPAVAARRAAISATQLLYGAGDQKLVRAAWGEELFSTEHTEPDNELSIVQFADFNGHRVLLTGDAGRRGLVCAITQARAQRIDISGLRVFQAPHHGSRRNVDAGILDALLGFKIPQPMYWDQMPQRWAMISAAEKDPDHPRKAIVRALAHRGYRPVTQEGAGWVRFYNEALTTFHGSPLRMLPYPDSHEAD